MKMRLVSISLLAFLAGAPALASLALGQNNASNNNAFPNNSAINNTSNNNTSNNNASSNNAGFNNVSGNTGNSAVNALDTADADPLNDASLDLPSNAATSNAVQNGVSTGASNTPSNSFGGSLGNVSVPPESVPADGIPSDADPLLAPAGASSSEGTGALAPGSAELPVADSEQEAYNQQIDTKIRPRLSGDLQRYCLDYCNILSIDVSSQENFNTANADLGFEGGAASI